MTPEELAQFFHETYERLAPDFGYKTRQESRKPWAEVPESNRRLMIAVCAEVLAAYRVSPEPKMADWETCAERRELKEENIRLRERLAGLGEGWISVDERLPEKTPSLMRTYCLVAIQGRDVLQAMWAESCASRENGDWAFFDVHRDGGRLPYVTHWRPLPTPPSRENVPTVTYDAVTDPRREENK